MTVRDTLDDRPSIRQIAAGILLVIVVVVVAYFNLRWPGWPFQPDRKLRLRWHFVAKNSIPKGSQVKADLVDGQFGWVPDEQGDEDVVGVASDVIDRFAMQTIAAGPPITKKMLSRELPLEPSGNVVIVPVEVKPSDMVSLQLGDRLAFVKENTILPSKKEGSASGGSFVLRAMATSPNAASAGGPSGGGTSSGGTSGGGTPELRLFVEVPATQMPDVPLLGTGVWRPVILPKNATASGCQGPPDDTSAPTSDLTKLLDALGKAGSDLGQALSLAKSADAAMAALAKTMKDDSAGLLRHLGAARCARQIVETKSHCVSDKLLADYETALEAMLGETRDRDERVAAAMDLGELAVMAGPKLPGISTALNAALKKDVDADVRCAVENAVKRIARNPG